MELPEQWIGVWPNVTVASCEQSDIGTASNAHHGPPIAAIHIWTDEDGHHVELERIDQ